MSPVLRETPPSAAGTALTEVCRASLESCEIHFREEVLELVTAELSSLVISWRRNKNMIRLVSSAEL